MKKKTRTDYRKQRRSLLEEIFHKIWLIQSFNDNELEKTKLVFFQNMDMDLEDIIKRKNREHYVPNHQVFVEKSSKSRIDRKLSKIPMDQEEQGY